MGEKIVLHQFFTCEIVDPDEKTSLFDMDLNILTCTDRKYIIFSTMRQVTLLLSLLTIEISEDPDVRQWLTSLFG